MNECAVRQCIYQRRFIGIQEGICTRRTMSVKQVYIIHNRCSLGEFVIERLKGL